jgi:NADH:ubiquinone oxidoreductase subunit C
MTLEQALSSAESLVKPFGVGAPSRDAGRLDVVVHPADLLHAVTAIVGARWGYLSAITGLDHPWPKTPAKPGAQPAGAAPAPAAGPMEDRLEALYHFVQGAAVLTLRVSAPYHDTRLPSVCSVIPSATLYERELQEMFGFVVEGTPDPGRLLLPDDWPEGVYPLRKAFSGLGTGTGT